MKTQDFEQACAEQVGGRLVDSSFNKDYTHPISLSIQEMREISNALRKEEGLEPLVVLGFEEYEEEMNRNELDSFK